MIHYVYRITNIELNKHYYGSRSTQIQPRLDLGFKYFSSSTDKEFIKDQKENPKNYTYKIIKCFSTRKEATEFEIRLHNHFNVGINESFYNKVKQTSTGFSTFECDESVRIKMSEMKKLYWTDNNRKIKSDSMKEYFKLEGTKEKNSKAIKKYYADNPSAKLKISERSTKQFSNSDVKVKISKRQIKFWEDNPDKRLRMKELKNEQAEANNVYNYYALEFENSGPFYSVSEASRQLNIPFGTLSNWYNEPDKIRTRGINKGKSPRDLGFYRIAVIQD